jgi:hypothetical protein
MEMSRLAFPVAVARARQTAGEITRIEGGLVGDAGDLGHLRHPGREADVATARSNGRGGADLARALGLRHTGIVRPVSEVVELEWRSPA